LPNKILVKNDNIFNKVMQPRLLLVLAAMLCIGLVQSQDEWVPLYKGFTEKEFKTADGIAYP
jgi:hypothetical protein